MTRLRRCGPAALLLAIFLLAPSAIDAGASGSAELELLLSETSEPGLEEEALFEDEVFEVARRPGGQCRPWGRICRLGSNDCCAPLQCAFDGYTAWCRY